MMFVDSFIKAFLFRGWTVRRYLYTPITNLYAAFLPMTELVASIVPLTLEQYRFELQGSTYMQIFFQ